MGARDKNGGTWTIVGLVLVIAAFVAGFAWLALRGGIG
jgi:hypothetical protein